jgi:hypothetical protein
MSITIHNYQNSFELEVQQLTLGTLYKNAIYGYLSGKNAKPTCTINEVNLMS